MSDIREEREALWYIADQIQSWLDWDKARRGEGDRPTEADTHIMTLPVPFWPTHGQLENWIKTLHAASGFNRHPFRDAQPGPKDTTP